MRNITVLTDYISNIERAYQMPEGSIRVILSEQGYNSSQGEELQAQALARGYYIAEFNDRVDAFIIRAVIDDLDEMRGNLYLGILDRYQGKKISFYVYEYMDSNFENFCDTDPKLIASSPTNQNKVRKAQEILGETRWENIIPSFNKNKLAGMP